MAASKGAHVFGLVLLARPPWTEYGTFVTSPSRSSSRQQTNWSAVLSSPGAWYTELDADCIGLLSRLPAATCPGGLLIYNGKHGPTERPSARLQISTRRCPVSAARSPPSAVRPPPSSGRSSHRVLGLIPALL